MIASLPMYDFPELRPETKALWRGLRRCFREAGIAHVPEELTWPVELETHWRAPDLLFSQTCGYPLTHALAGQVALLATPRYRADGCAGAAYCSFLIVRSDDAALPLAGLSGRTVAVNGLDSQSGYNVLRYHLTELGLEPGFLGPVLLSGGHRNSVALVRAGKADLCAIDCVSWALLAQVAPAETAGLGIIARTAEAPCLPFITAKSVSAEEVARLQAGLDAAFKDEATAAVRSALLLAGVEFLPVSAYDVILRQERAADARMGLPKAREDSGT
jgi:ABC-type phosphate/phosphonate transport system substrate-binding protein